MAAAPATEPTVTPAMAPLDNEGAAVGRTVDVEVDVAGVPGETAVDVGRTLRLLNRLASCVLLKPFFGSVKVAPPVALLGISHLYPISVVLEPRRTYPPPTTSEIGDGTAYPSTSLAL
jgi:hypothetical protein